MAKGRKTAALAALGLGAAALSGMFDKKKDGKTEDKSKDTTADASAGMAKDRLGAAGLDRGDKDTTSDASSGMTKDRLSDLEKAKARAKKGAESTAKTPIRKAPARAANPATSQFSVPTAANRAESARLARLGGRDNSMMDELQGLGRLRENRGDMTETGSERIARKQVAAAGRLRDSSGMKKGGMVKSSASKRADGCAVKGKTKGRMV